MAYTWTNSIRPHFGDGGSGLTEQGANGLNAILTEMKNKIDHLEARTTATTTTTTTTV